MAQASAFIHQLQLDLDDTRQKMEEQVTNHLALRSVRTEVVCAMMKQSASPLLCLSHRAT
jgi:hypothetical protein